MASQDVQPDSPVAPPDNPAAGGVSAASGDPVAEQGQQQPSGLSLANSLGVLVGLLGFVTGARTLVDNSFLTHLATGRLILDSGGVPSADPYSRLAAGEAWTVQSWLVSLLYAVLEELMGLGSVRLVHGLVAAAVALGIWQLLGSAGTIVPRLALTLIPIVVGIGFWSPRPLMFGLLAMVVLLQVLELGRAPWILVPLMWLWANSHGSYPLAFVLLGAVAVGSMLDQRALSRRALPRRELQLMGHALAGTLLAVVGPLGPRVLWFPFQLLSRREALDGVVEWQAPLFTKPSELAYLALLPVLVLAGQRGASWRAMLPSLAFVVAGLLASRNLAVASVIVVVMLGPSLAGLLGADRGDEVGLLSRTLGRAGVVGAVVAALAVLVAPATDFGNYPVAEVDFLESRGLVPAGADDDLLVVHREAVGNYLGFRYGSGAGAFIDDRFDFYPLDLTEDHLRLLDGGDVAEVLERRGADVVLWQADESLADWLIEADNWQLVSVGDEADPEWLVACRLDSPSARPCFQG